MTKDLDAIDSLIIQYRQKIINYEELSSQLYFYCEDEEVVNQILRSV
jgi:hypothetical protein